MFSELKRLSNLFIVLFIISGFCSILSIKNLYDYKHLINTDFEVFFYICSYLAIFVPIAFLSLGVALKKISDLLTVKESTLYERLNKLEEKQN